MGKGGKNNNKVKEVVKSQSEEQQQDFDQDQEEDLQDFDDESQLDQDQELLKKIQDQIISANQPLKLSWAAIHNLKAQELKLMHQMNKEMQLIQNKYDKLKEPISQQIAKVVSGHPVQKKLYTQHELTKSISPNKHKPNAIPQFWLQVFQKSGLIDSEIDINIMRTCTNLHCNTELIKQDGKEQQQIITVQFTFGQNAYFENSNFKLSAKRVGEQCEKLHVDQLKLKGEKDTSSFFMNLFDQQISSAPLYQSVQDIQRSYNNSLFFFFHQGQEDNYDDLEDQNDQNEDEQDENDCQDEDQVAAIKKKKKMNTENMQKPECKQQ